MRIWKGNCIRQRNLQRSVIFTISMSGNNLYVSVRILLLKFYVLFNIAIMRFLVLLRKYEPLDVILRTKNSEHLLRECLSSICAEIPVRRIIIVDAGSTDLTKEIASAYDNVDFYVKSDFNLGQATQFGFSKAQTEWVAVIDSDIVLRKGWFNDMKKYMDDADAVEGCRIDHYSFIVQKDSTKSNYGRFGQTLLKREPVLSMDIHVPFGEDTIIKFNFDKRGKKWKKVPNFLADHYTKLESAKHSRTGLIFRPEPHIIHIPKNVQIQQGRIARKYLTRRQVIRQILLPPIYEAYWSFKKYFWFTLAYFRLM